MSDQPDYHWYHELGFIDNSRALRTFRHAVKIFMKATPHRLHIVPWDNTVSFHEMVLQFMEEHAEKYWGSSREVNVDDNTLKYPEDSARILEGMRNLLANKIRDFNRSKGSASYSLTLPNHPKVKSARRKRPGKRPSCFKELKALENSNVDDEESNYSRQCKKGHKRKFKHDDQGVEGALIEKKLDYDENGENEDNKKAEVEREGCQNMVKEEVDWEEVRREKKVKIEMPD